MESACSELIRAGGNLALSVCEEERLTCNRREEQPSILCVYYLS